MEYLKKIISSILIILSTFLGITKIEAGSLSVTVSNPSPIVGSNVIVTVNATDLAGNFSIVSSNGSVLSGGTSSVWIDNSKTTFTFKANAVGSATISVIPKDVADYSTQKPYTTTKTAVVNVKNKPVVVLSSNNYLSTLGVENASLNPEFNKEQLEYTVEMEPGTTKINITGSAEDKTASVEGLGEKEVSEGNNRFEIKTVAQNGNARTYILNVNVKEYNPIEIDIDGLKYRVVRKRSELNPVTNYKETTIQIGEEEVPAYTSEITKYTLIGLKDDKGTINYYIVQGDNRYTLYQEYTFQKIVLYPMEMKQVPKHYQKSVIVLDDREVPVYKLKETSKYALIYGMNVETGKENLYQYNSEENTLQIYTREESEILEIKNEQYKMIGLSLGGACIILLIIIIILIIVICRLKKKTVTKKKLKQKQIEESISE